MSEFINPLDYDKERKIAADKADIACEFSFPKERRASDESNRLWLQVFWREFHAMVKK